MNSLLPVLVAGALCGEGQGGRGASRVPAEERGLLEVGEQQEQ